MTPTEKKKPGHNPNFKGRKAIEVDIPRALELMALGVPKNRVAAQIGVSYTTLVTRLAALKGESK